MASDSDATKIQLHQLFFQPYLSEDIILKRVRELGQTLKDRMEHRHPVFLVMLKGATLFAADLIQASELRGEIDFVPTASYSGTTSTREVRMLLAPDPDLVKGRDIVLIEDIVDSGYTMEAFLPKLEALGPSSITLVTLLHKPAAQQVKVKIDLIGFSIPNQFVVGYGLDYNGLGRELRGIYSLAEEY